MAASRLRKIARFETKNEPCIDLVKDPYEEIEKSLKTVRGGTGIVIESSVSSHECSWDVDHPERSERLTTIIRRIKELGLIERCCVLTPRRAEKHEIVMCHSEDDYNSLQLASKIASVNFREHISSQFDSIFINNDTFDDALTAAGSAIDLVDAVWKGSIQNGIALVRPPGHHAVRDDFNGYCFFNNVAVAAKHALLNLNVDRILIVDLDVHHGQGIQQTFYDEKRVLYFSMHRYEEGKFWPNLRLSDYDHIGENKGRGYNWNVPLNRNAMTNGDYLAIFHHLLLPVAVEFSPELVIVSAGYDAAYGCPEGEMLVTPSCYAHMVWSLMQLGNGKIALILEGGYCLKSLAEGAALSLRALLGDPCPYLGPLPPPCSSIVETILNVITVQRPFWKCLKSYPSYVVKGNEVLDEGKHVMVEPKFYGVTENVTSTFPTRACYPSQSIEQKNLFEKTLDEMISSTDLFVPPNNVCIAFDEIVLRHSPLDSLRLEFELPGRVTQIMADLKVRGLYERCSHLKPRNVKLEELKAVHTKNYVDLMNSTKYMGNEEIARVADDYESVYLCPYSVDSARAAAGAVLQVTDGVLSRQYRSGVAIVRPPGHHSGCQTASGFCIFNNVAIAAKYAKSKFGLKRILILDWDVHHGNGTQEIFKSDPDVLYISLHRYSVKFFPYSKEGNYDYVGEEEGGGFTVNIPWVEGKACDGQYVTAFHRVILPICYEFSPELVLVSAGFDALDGDPLGGCKVTPQCFAHLTHYLMALANGKVILCLEGGYNFQATSYGITSCVKALLGDPLPSFDTKLALSKAACKTLQNVTNVHKQFWTSLAVNIPVPEILHS
ncbi:histone deacetylase 6 isoform X1 [Bacillus rossius redtenbacheri]|uniref:histone deacetylase 6 isoform X1 n=1 Tax=Bacillus rossius redtenbacheri TaxID=93214 RepID=UPI002FDF0722